MRQNEICTLQMEDVDRQRRTVIIRDRKDAQKKQGNEGGELLLCSFVATSSTRVLL